MKLNTGERIKELRKAKGISQTKVAEGIGYGKSIVAYWEKGVYSPTAEAVVALALFFDVSSDYLLGLEDLSGAKIRPE